MAARSQSYRRIPSKGFTSSLLAITVTSFLVLPASRTWAIFLSNPLTAANLSPLQQKALTFGQSQAEIATVNYYLKRLDELAIKQHPEELSDVEHVKANKSLDDELKSFNRRMHDESSSSTDVNPEENGHFYEGDIVLDAIQARQLYERAAQHGHRTKRKFIGSPLRRWDSTKPIAYSFDGSHTLRERKVIELALEHWHNITCLDFVRLDDEPEGNRIVFTDVDGCASNVGRHPLGEPQFVSLAPECIRLGVIAHEVAHALGFWHEQSRPDRDRYVTVQWENIDKDSKGQFLKEQPIDVDDGDVPYDYGSIMHYRSKAFAKYEDLFTVSTNIPDYQKTIGQRDQLSFNDIRLMNKIYCSKTCPQQLPCERGGYTDPRRCDRCRCPDGFTGKLCNEVMPGYGASCGGRIEVTKNWQTISSPGYPEEFREGQECSWLLVAPANHHVELQFVGNFEMYCKVRHSLCMDYIEIRNSTDFANTGMRYCCFGTPKGRIRSATTDMLVLFRSFYRSGKGFQAQIRSAPAPGSFYDWSEWSPCSASCGGCGTRFRTRRCVTTHTCIGPETDSEVCGRTPCEDFCPTKTFVTTECGGFLAGLNRFRCKQEKTLMLPCINKCCPGFQLEDSKCIEAKNMGFALI